MSQLKSIVSLKEVGPLKKYVGCTVVSNCREDVIMCQPDLLKKLERIFKGRIASTKLHKTSAILGEISNKIKDPTSLDESTAMLFHYIVAMLLFLCK
jgi:hypothetical protein